PVLSLYGNADSSGTDFIILARLFDFGATVDTGDWRTPAQLPNLPLLAEYDTSDGVSTSGYNDFTSEEGFASAIDTNGVTRIVLSSSRHESLTEPAQNEYVQLRTVETSGTSQDPKLTLEIEEGATGSASFSLGGLGLSATGHR